MRRFKGLFRKGEARATVYHVAVVIALAVFTLGLIISALLSRSIAMQNEKDFEISNTIQLTGVKTYLQYRTQAYEQLLTAGAALFNVSQQVTREQWRQFYVDMETEKRYPSIVGLGYTTYLSADEVSEHELQVQSEGFSEFRVYPQEPARDIYTAITYLEPFDAKNLKAFGYDMYSDSMRRQAMELARDTASVIVSGPVQLVQDAENAGNDVGRVGILVYYPVYASKTAPKTIEERREQIIGYTYLISRPSDMVRQYISETQEFSDKKMVLQDTLVNDNRVLYQSEDVATYDPSAAYAQDFVINKRWWRVELVESQDTLLNTTIIPGVVLGLGAVLASLASFVGFRSTLKRLGIVEERYARQVQETKEELLALASHQLRTPASGVKQYLGILTSGMFGELTPEQATIARKAYDANERQIQIVNELLYVSKADAGQLRMEFEMIDLVSIVNAVIEQVGTMARIKDIQISLKAPEHLEILGDDRYLPMIIENMLTNAIKYSYMSSKVEIVVRDDKDSATVAVKDYGVGISKDDIARIFQKFDRIHNPLSHSEGGSGLGLFLALQLANAHSGTIEVRSRLGKGSTFTLLLPKMVSADDPVGDNKNPSE